MVRGLSMRRPSGICYKYALARRRPKAQRTLQPTGTRLYRGVWPFLLMKNVHMEMEAHYLSHSKTGASSVSCALLAQACSKWYVDALT